MTYTKYLPYKFSEHMACCNNIVIDTGNNLLTVGTLARNLIIVGTSSRNLLKLMESQKVTYRPHQLHRDTRGPPDQELEPQNHDSQYTTTRYLHSILESRPSKQINE